MEERMTEVELVSVPATPRGFSTPETSVTPTSAARVKASWTPTAPASATATPCMFSPSGPMGTPMRRVAVSLRGYLEDVGHLTRLNPQDAWLPITESRNGNAHYAAFHNLNVGIGFQALVLPVAFAFLGWYSYFSLYLLYFS
ncbi:Lysine histidine transporter-like 8 [Platanthera guangdongensis]|uniref:Lysine histidine transporter-like 8 n=1 Tax=Platanthera guangdongensis TaxID=2320717 RepID=A0ABR2M288_9ASPA